jgi:peptide/nickel transport system substrate-binding protein
MWQGDWAKGHAGGYGTDESDWRGQYDIWDHKAGLIAENTEWFIDAAKDEGTIVYTIRQGVHWAVNSVSDVSLRMNGREMTADDVVYYLTRVITDERSYLYKTNLPLREAVITKTGPWEVTVKVPLNTLITAIFRFGDVTKIGPPELKDSNLSDWRDVSFGTGAYMTTDYVPASSITMVKNPNYWMKNPVGPGIGDQLPYIENVKFFIIADSSTRQAAFRTGAVDIALYELDDANLMREQAPKTMWITNGEATLPMGSPESIDMPGDVPPFGDIRVRRALFMATDLQAINEGLYSGLGVIETWPYQGVKGYEALRVGMNDPDCPESVKELYTYNPEKAKQLLAEAGYPNGFKTKALSLNTAADFWSIIKDQWAKIGVELEIDVVDMGAKNSILNQRDNWYQGITDGGVASDSAFHTTPTLTGVPSAAANTCRIFNPKLDQWLEDIRSAILARGTKAGILEAREMVKYAVDQAYAIPVPYTYKYVFWWPWLKNFTGEYTVGYYNDPNYVPFIWIDEALKKSMGY